MIARILCLSVVVGIMSNPAGASFETHLSIPASGCRWDPLDDSAVYTDSFFNHFWIFANGANVKVYCPFPNYTGRDSSNHFWGTHASHLSAGEVRVVFDSSSNTQARFIHYDEYDNSSTAYSLCAYASGSGVLTSDSGRYPGILYPAACSSSYGVTLVQINVPNGGTFRGVEVDDYN